MSFRGGLSVNCEEILSLQQLGGIRSINEILAWLSFGLTLKKAAVRMRITSEL